ncbi:MAG: hypothetical protein A2728_02685 [Candidatus Spechtbacteria bacterium RIFCSPHIGHO2_01_FULL_38_11]|nr:MAG: hypothetical protein A2728_02685 [Candidatus Spechtbacteria bacterium RIFCSPHIGHO2_01_FULL_38_11]
MLVDTHAHLHFHSFRNDREEVIKRTLDEGISFVMPGTQIDTSRAGVELAEKLNDSRIYASIGLHPIHVNKDRVDEDEVGLLEKFTTREESFNRGAYEELIVSSKVIAVGEIGLDYWRKPKTTARKKEFVFRQKDAFTSQLDLALQYKKPLILHCRVAHDDMLDILKNHPITTKLQSPGVVHSYTGTLEQLKKFLDMGFYIGVNGLVFKLPFVEDAVAQAPLERIVLETDAPYLLPPLPAVAFASRELRRNGSAKEGQVKDTERNEPIFIKHTAQKIADIKGLTLQEVEAQTTKNAQTLFGVEFK